MRDCTDSGALGHRCDGLESRRQSGIGWMGGRQGGVLQIPKRYGHHYVSLGTGRGRKCVLLSEPGILSFSDAGTLRLAH